jgi:hypothetical protein
MGLPQPADLRSPPGLHVAVQRDSRPPFAVRVAGAAVGKIRLARAGAVSTILTLGMVAPTGYSTRLTNSATTWYMIYKSAWGS